MLEDLVINGYDVLGAENGQWGNCVRNFGEGSIFGLPAGDRIRAQQQSKGHRPIPLRGGRYQRRLRI